MSTIDYYNNNAKNYFDFTINANMQLQYDSFLKFVKRTGKILDFGCGSGRDSLYFKNKGYDVTAIDGSEEMCKLAREYTGLDVKCMDFNDFHEIDSYDGIWACGSLSHIEKKDMLDMLKRLRDALMQDGHIFIAMKRGFGEELTQDGRFYSYLDFSDMEDLADKADLKSMMLYMSKSVNNPDEPKYWNNYILRRK